VSTLRSLVEARIAAQVTAFREVAGSASLEEVLKGRLVDKGCYIFEEADAAGKNEVVQVTRQRVTVQLGVVLVVRNVRGDRGEDASDANKTLRDSVQTALLGYEFTGGYEPMEYIGFRLVSFANGFFITKASYRTRYFIRSS
jgi:hypothetical protein